jgi:hypothetical protein
MNFTRLFDPSDLLNSDTRTEEFDAFVFVFAPNDESAIKINRTVAFLLRNARAACVIVTPDDLDLAPEDSSLKKLTELAEQFKLSEKEHACAVWIHRDSLKALSNEQLKGGYFDLMSSDETYVKDQVVRCLREAESCADPALRQKIWDIAKLLIPFAKAGVGHP